MEFFIIKTFHFIYNAMFSPLVLISLLITSLSLILNLKETNLYIKNFKKHENHHAFINKIFQTIILLISIFIIGIIVNYLKIPNEFTITILWLYGFLSIVYLILTLYLAWSLFHISFMIVEVIKTSLRDD